MAGFVGHNARKACSHCLKPFPRIGDRTDCSGFDRDTWPKRSYAIHCEYARKGLSAQIRGKTHMEFPERPYNNEVVIIPISAINVM